MAPVFVLHPTAEQLALLTATEPNYDLALERVPPDGG